MQHKILATCVIMLTMGLADGAALAQMQAPAGSGSAGSIAFTPATDFSVNGTLAARVLFLGRSGDGKALTVSAEIKNIGDGPTYVALMGPTPSAVDSSGATFTLKRIAGIAGCGTWDNQYLSECLRNTKQCTAIRNFSYVDCLPGDLFVELQPGASSVIGLGFESEEAGSGEFTSFAINLAQGFNSKPSNQNNRETADLVNIPIIFPLVRVYQ